MAQTQADDWKPVWEDPPELRAERMLWAERLQVLIKKPGQWAKIAEFPDDEKTRAHQLRSALNRRRYTIPQPEGEWEFTTRQGKVYARYVGSGEGSE